MDPAKMKDRILEFINGFYDWIQKMPEDTFKTHINTAIKSIQKKHDSLVEEFDLNFDEIIGESYIFNIRELLAQTYEMIKHEQLVDFFYDNLVHDTSRCYVSVGIYGKTHHTCIPTKKIDIEIF